MSIVQIVTLDITQLNIIKDSLKTVSKSLKDLFKVTKHFKRQLGQLYCKLFLQLQKRNNFSVIPIKVQYVNL